MCFERPGFSLRMWGLIAAAAGIAYLDVFLQRGSGPHWYLAARPAASIDVKQ
jgi:hypothetical protein